MTRATRRAANPLAAGLHDYRMADSALMVIFGASGDLAGRKLLPSLYNLAKQRLLPPGFAVVGAAMDDLSEPEFRKRAGELIKQHSRTQPVDKPVLESFLAALYYQPLNFDDAAGFKALDRRLGELDQERHTGGNVVFYCATPPPTYPIIIEALNNAGMSEVARGYRRIIIEKPFGTDLKSAQDLNRRVQAAFHEDCVYRIDHYLGKETVQNILAFRFANSIFEPIWNNQHVDSVQITAAEELGIEKRGAYYEHAGAMRDIVQNHAMQLVTLVGMEPPLAFDAQAVRDEKVKLLRSIRPIEERDAATQTVRGQYGAGWVLGEKVPGYRQEAGVAADSQTETYVALQFQVDNWRWAGVPFYVRAAKRMPKRVTEIRIQFKRPPHLTFGRAQTRDLEPNAITLRIQPEEGISLRFGAKVPTAGLQIRSVNMDFMYMTSFLIDAPDAYERLLTDCMLGDPTLFTRADEVDAAWSLVDPIEKAWAAGKPKLASYAAGSWGPKAADRLLEAQGRAWHRP